MTRKRAMFLIPRITVTIAITLGGSLTLSLQHTSPGAASRGPTLDLVQPPPNGSVPADRAMLGFRYAPGDPADPIDDASFRVWLDGAERTAGFRAGNGEVWGTLAGASSGSRARESGAAAGASGAAASAPPRPIAPGAHLVIARICTLRGSCTQTTEIVTALPTPASPDDSVPR